ncbi:PREDICTED: glutathione S-transferase T3-like [Brassica oleracea var. oleracea]|uniref:Myb-like domain-containing protein n=1 Tax=Brassica oleracea var. oleracea TaxID=109376 RepID=A0A0D3BX64_BRAOL|nr:PREDICTED: glutathione S-transferase T3-like [Brassica oleracea var. oleracea]
MNVVARCQLGAKVKVIFSSSFLNSFLTLFCFSHFLTLSFSSHFLTLSFSYLLLAHVLEMDSNPFTQTSNFVGLLYSQQNISFGNYEDNVDLSSSQLPSQGVDDVGERRERRKWTRTDDVVLISSWLNTSKDPVVGNEQRSGAFWKRIAAYFAASPKLAGCEKIEASHCKQRWHRINDLVCKFCGSYEAATREKSSGCNENDVLKRAHEIFYINHMKKFTLEHAWKELSNDQKWCEVSTAKNDGKKRKCEDNEDSPSLQSTETKRPTGVKAAKASGKKSVEKERSLNEFHNIWDIKQKDFAQKERLHKLSLLDSLVARKEPLAEYEETLKKKLISDLMFN